MNDTKCNLCNGKPRTIISNECVKHDICIKCAIPRAELKDTPWGHDDGWICAPCAKKHHEMKKNEALTKAAQKPYDADDYWYLDEMVCPYCDYEFDNRYEFYESDGEIIKCDRCDNKLKVTCDQIAKFTTERIETK